MKQIIKLKFSNGLEYDAFYHEVLSLLNLDNKFQFIEENEIPDVIIFGPYGNDLPPKGKYIRLGYFCENIIPDLSICEFAFGVPSQTQINNSRYHTINWHDFDPNSLIKENKRVYCKQKSPLERKFCNFLYSNQVRYREDFFRELSKYKSIDAPGLSMKNMNFPKYKESLNKWDEKRFFLSEYKFTIAFENYSFPGYRTEKLYDPMLAESIPIYYGDETIHEIFNDSSFINCHNYNNEHFQAVKHFIDLNCQMNFNDYRPAYYHSFTDRIRRKIKSSGRKLKMDIIMSKQLIKRVVDRIVELDENEVKYLEMLNEPNLLNKDLKSSLDSMRKFWEQIFNTALTK